MFTPLSGPWLNLTFFETYFASVAGGIFGAAVFYFAAEGFIHRAHRNKVAKRLEAENKGEVYLEKKKFTRTNRFIVSIKRKLGIIGICFWAPFFLSIPLGSIITAKFYGKKKITFVLICLGMFINAIATTGIAYLIY